MPAMYKHSILFWPFIRNECFQNKSKFITEDHFTKRMNITIRLIQSKMKLFTKDD
jgi:hypothetical protein